MAHLKKETFYTGGLEERLSSFAGFLIFIGIGAFIACLIVGEGKSYIWIGTGSFSLVIMIIWGFLFWAGSEIIRLLKKLNSLPYGGKISVAKEISNLVCSNCGTLVINSEQKKCNGCKEPFE